MTKFITTAQIATQANTAADIWEEIANDPHEWVVAEQALMIGDYIDGNKGYQVVFSPDINRAAVTCIGSGCGDAQWTDATSIEDALRRYLCDEMSV